MELDAFAIAFAANLSRTCLPCVGSGPRGWKGQTSTSFLVTPSCCKSGLENNPHCASSTHLTSRFRNIGLSTEICTFVVANSNNAVLFIRTEAGGPYVVTLYMRRAWVSEDHTTVVLHLLSAAHPPQLLELESSSRPLPRCLHSSCFPTPQSRSGRTIQE